MGGATASERSNNQNEISHQWRKSQDLDKTPVMTLILFFFCSGYAASHTFSKDSDVWNSSLFGSLEFSRNDS